MPRGRKPLSTTELRLRGGFRPDRHGGGEFDLPNATGEAPGWLPNEAKAVWDDLIRPLIAANIVQAPDLAVAAATVTQFCLWRQSAMSLASMEPQQPGYSALARAVNANWAAFSKGASMLGLEPSARETLRRQVRPAVAVAVQKHAGRFAMRESYSIKGDVDPFVINGPEAIKRAKQG